MPNNDTITIDRRTVKFFAGPPVCDSKEAIFTEAVRRAYSDMSRHTLHFTSEEYYAKDAEKLKENLKKKLVCRFLEFADRVLQVSSDTDFDDIHNEMCQKVSEVFTTKDETSGLIPIELNKGSFSMGQAQKVVNMVWKYVYLFYQYYYAVSKKYQQELHQFERIIAFLHAPLDSYLIYAVSKKTSKYLKSQIKPSNPSWSKMDEEQYKEFQKSLRDALKEEGTCPFQWELENWPFK